MIKQLDDGKLSINKAYNTLKQQKKILETQLKQKDDKMQDAMSKENILRKEIQNLKLQLEGKKNVIIEKKVVPQDYETTQNKLKNSQQHYNRLKQEFDKKNQELINLKKQISYPLN